MKATRFFAGIVLAGLALAAIPNAAAAAPGVVLDKNQLAPTARQSLTREIGKARAKHPKLFAQVAQAPDMAKEADDSKRGPYGTITLALRALGPEAVPAMLEMLAIDGPTRGKLSDTAWTTLQVGLIEAVGLHRDPRSRPVLMAIVDKKTDFQVVRAAAEALGRLGDDASAKFLAARVKRPGLKQLAILGGIGECRRVVAAQALASVAAKTPKDPMTAQSVLKALGAIGSAWAWETPEVKKSGEGAKVRAIAAKALLLAFVGYDGELRKKAETALLLVDDPSTPQLIASAKRGASPALVGALDALAQRFANNPVR